MKRFKRLLAAFLAGVMVAGMSTTAFAEEPGYTPVDPYVINYDNVTIEGYENFEGPNLYYSPHRGSMDIYEFEGYDSEQNEIWELEGYSVAYKVYNLINTKKVAEGNTTNATGAWASLEAYCVDASVSATAGKSYRRVNLEDSQHFDDTTAGELRAIYLNSFPYIKNMTEIEDAVNAWLKAQGRTDELISGLTGAEAIAATQNAVWDTANGTDVVNELVYEKTAYYTADELKKDKGAVFPEDEYVDSVEETEQATTKNNIERLNEYLLALEPVGPTDKAVSEASFTATSISRGTENGVPYMTVTAKVDVDLTNSELDLTAKVGDQFQTVDIVAGQDTYTFKFTNPTAETADLFIDGEQTVADVFMFMGKDRLDTQCMMAYDDSALPVHAETKVTPDHVINFNKTTTKDNVVYPLEGITFDIYYAGTVDEYTQYVKANGAVVDADGKVSDTYVEYVKGLDKVETSVTTDILGKASYNAEQNAGVYLIIEQSHPAIEAPLDPFLVSIPTTTADGTGLTYTLNLTPKNQVKKGPEVLKDVTEIDNDLDTFDVNAVHTWIIRGEIPSDMAIGKSYVISDTLDYRLTYKGDLVVKVGYYKDADHKDSANQETNDALVEGTDYTVTVGKKTTADGEVDTFKVSLTKAGMEKVAEIAGANYADYEVRVYFNAVIDEDAQMGVLIPNKATLDYTNSVNFDFTDESDIPEVYTCGVNILKYDAKEEETKLKGAEFKLARKATAVEIADEKIATSTLVIARNTPIEVVYVDFYDNVKLTGEKVNTITTDENGKAVIYGLEELFDEQGETAAYYLVETKAPAGYNLLSYPVEVKLNRTSHETGDNPETDVIEQDMTVKVANSNAFTLPSTGGIGTGVFTLVGAALALGSGAVLVGKKRKEEE